MKRIFGLVSVLLVLGLVGCAQVGADQVVMAQKAGSITLYIAADAEGDNTPAAGDDLWAVGELGSALGGTVDFWSAKAKYIGDYGTDITVTTTVALDTVSSQWGSPTTLECKFLYLADGGVPGTDPHTEFTTANVSLLFYAAASDFGTEKTTSYTGITYKINP
ncbi:hypothetical protein BREVNS_0915 [Brevinematales bacterium NS]|nr:hypothetical protein BREVNS_0915 [Brevinematales bacterium NS]